jgi:hypothetical protein
MGNETAKTTSDAGATLTQRFRRHLMDVFSEGNTRSPRAAGKQFPLVESPAARGHHLFGESDRLDRKRCRGNINPACQRQPLTGGKGLGRVTENGSSVFALILAAKFWFWNQFFAQIAYTGHGARHPTEATVSRDASDLGGTSKTPL